MDDLVDLVFDGEPNLASCPWGKCEDRGEFIRCYINHETCPNYSRHRDFLFMIREMGAESDKRYINILTRD